MRPVYDPTKSHTRIPGEIVSRLLQIKIKGQEHIALHRLIMLLEPMMIRMISQLRQGYTAKSPNNSSLYYLKTVPMKDLVQSSYPALLDAAKRFEIRNNQSIYSFFRYLKTMIARSLIAQYRYAGQVKEEVEYYSDLTDCKERSREARSRVKDILEATARDNILTRRQQQAINLQLRGYTYREAAKKMNTTPNGVALLLRDARCKIRKLIKNFDIIR